MADRSHLVQNLREHLQRFLDHKRTCLPVVEEILLKEGLPHDSGSIGSLADQAQASALLPSAEHSQAEDADQQMSGVQTELQGISIEQEVELSSLTYAERKKKISRDKRMARYEQVLALHRAGIGQRAIARELQMSRHVVQRFITSPAFPERAPGSGLRAIRKSKLAPYLPYLCERWDAGTHNSSHLFCEMKERGYTGSESLLRRLLGEWRTALPPKPRQGKPRKPRLVPKPRKQRLSSRSAAFLMILTPEKLTVRQQQQVEQMEQNEELHRVYRLAQEFIELLKERQAQQLPDWLKRATESQITELKSFANGIRRDYAAVRAAFSLPWSNGVVEGHVNRLKFLKRQMFGRAHLDLLRVKVLHAV